MRQWHLSGSDFFYRMPEAKQRFSEKAAHLRFEKNTIIFFEGDPGDSCYYVQSGLVRIFSLTSSGKEPVFFLRRPGDLFGLSEVMEGHPRKANAQALLPCELMRVKSGDFDDLLRNDHEMTRRLIGLLGSRIRYLGERISHLVACSVMERLIKLLIYMAFERLEDTQSDNDRPVTVPIHLTQEQIASMTGSTQPTVNELLQSLQKEGLIEVSRKQIVVCEPLGLRAKGERMLAGKD